MSTLLRLILAVVVVVAVGVLLLGYWGGSREADGDRPIGTTGIDTERAREIGAEAGERAATAAARARAELDEAGVTTRIKAKMALDELVQARDVEVSTEGTVVTLRGTVASNAERERAERLAQETSGVTAVNNQLLVRP